ncbi:hypothetical protein D3C87_347490 [compost metagenome]
MKKIIVSMLMLLSICTSTAFAAFASSNAESTTEIINLKYKIYSTSGGVNKIIAKSQDNGVPIFPDEKVTKLSTSEITTKAYFSSHSTTPKKNKKGEIVIVTDMGTDKAESGYRIDTDISSLGNDTFKIQYAIEISEILGFSKVTEYNIEIPELMTRNYQFSVIAKRGKLIKKDLASIFNSACNRNPTEHLGSQKIKNACLPDTQYFIELDLK